MFAHLHQSVDESVRAEPLRVLVADDDPTSRLIAETLVRNAGYEPVSFADGAEAWEALQVDHAPRLALLDWEMPGLDGVEICRRLRASDGARYTYTIILTGRVHRADVVHALEAGADDYVTKPFDAAEICSRLRAGQRIVELEAGLAQRLTQLQGATAEIRRLEGLLPICMHCRKIRDERQAWQSVESYIQERSEARFTHSICPTCVTAHYPEYADD